MATWMSDVGVMGFLYRDFYGRSLMNEIAPEADDGWVFDEATHKYRRLTAAERLEAAEAEKARVEEVRARLKAERGAAEERQSAADARRDARRRAREIRTGKAEGRAARVLQRWWRARLYDPPAGILYLRARDRFGALASASD
jgi:hypothetical protein